MDTDLLITEIGTIVLAASVIAGAVFLVMYTVLARWWETATGWYIWTSSLAFAVILAYNYAALAGWITTYRPWVRLLIYAGILGVMIWRGVLLLTAQVRGYRESKRSTGKHLQRDSN